MSAKSDRTGEEDAASDDDDENATINNSSIQEASDTIGTSPPVVPVDGLALDRINDILDFETEHILNDRSTRFEHYECLAVSFDTNRETLGTHARTNIHTTTTSSLILSFSFSLAVLLEHTSRKNHCLWPSLRTLVPGRAHGNCLWSSST